MIVKPLPLDDTVVTQPTALVSHALSPHSFTQLVENFVCHPYHCQMLRGCTVEGAVIIIIIIIIIITYLLNYLLLTYSLTYLLTYLFYLLTAIEFSLGGSSPYTSTDKTNRINIHKRKNTKKQCEQYKKN